MLHITRGDCVVQQCKLMLDDTVVRERLYALFVHFGYNQLSVSEAIIDTER